MSDAKRYRHEPAFMVICSDGDYVLESKYSDLKAEVAGLKTGYQAYERVNAELNAELKALRKDAERINWLDGQSRPVVEGQCMSNPEGELTGYDWGVFGQCSTVREAIDYAMSAGERP